MGVENVVVNLKWNNKEKKKKRRGHGGSLLSTLGWDGVTAGRSHVCLPFWLFEALCLHARRFHTRIRETRWMAGGSVGG